MYLPSFPNLDLFSAGVNALNGVLVARNPSHNRGYTAAGLLIMALFGGIGGGVSRDLLLNDIPSPIKDPSYIFVCLVAGLLGLAIYRYAESKEEHFRKRILAFFKSFTLPWFAILGARKGPRSRARLLQRRSGWTPGHHGWRRVDRCVLRGYTGSGDAVRTHCHDGSVGGWGLRRNRPAREAEHAFLSGHPDCGTGFISVPRACGAGSLAAGRANERPTTKTSGRATGKASAFVSELKKKEATKKRPARLRSLRSLPANRTPEYEVSRP